MTNPDHAVTVRRLRAQDLDRWRVLWNGYLSFYRADVTDDVTALTFRRLCDGEHGMLGLVAVGDDDQPVGLAHLIFHASTWSDPDYCYLEDLFVDPAYRGGGVSMALFDAVYAHARDQGCERVYWLTQQYNGRARSLYDKVGQLTSSVLYEHMLG